MTLVYELPPPQEGGTPTCAHTGCAAYEETVEARVQQDVAQAVRLRGSSAADTAGAGSGSAYQCWPL